MTRLAIAALRAVLVVLLLCALAAQVIIVPAIARDVSGSPSLDGVAVAYVAAVAIVIMCAQAALVAIWALLGRVRRGSIFSARAFVWVDVIIASGLVATAILVSLALHVYLVIEPPLDAPGLVVISGGAAALGTAFVLLMIVMRSLLRAATGFRGELDEVV